MKTAFLFLTFFVLFVVPTASAQMCQPFNITNIGSWDTTNPVVLVCDFNYGARFAECYDADNYVGLDDNISIYLEWVLYPGEPVNVINNDSWELILSPVANDNVYSCFGRVGNEIVVDSPFDNVHNFDVGIYTISGSTGLYVGGNGTFEVSVRYTCTDFTKSATIGNVTFITADFNGDGTVNIADVAIFSTKYSGGYDQLIDFVYDGNIDIADVSYFAGTVGTSCP